MKGMFKMTQLRILDLAYHEALHRWSYAKETLLLYPDSEKAQDNELRTRKEMLAIGDMWEKEKYK